MLNPFSKSNLSALCASLLLIECEEAKCTGPLYINNTTTDSMTSVTYIVPDSGNNEEKICTAKWKKQNGGDNNDCVFKYQLWEEPQQQWLDVTGRVSNANPAPSHPNIAKVFRDQTNGNCNNISGESVWDKVKYIADGTSGRTQD